MSANGRPQRWPVRGHANPRAAGAKGRQVSRALALIAFLAATLVLPFLLFGGALEQALGGDALLQWLRGFGRWAWLIALALQMADIVLPVPSSAIMAALGMLYGPWVGGALASAGAIAAGLLAYGLCRLLGRGFARWLLGDDQLAAGERLFTRAGGWIVALTRWQPILPEVTACLAGMLRMPVAVFGLALACGSLPLGFAFAWVGYLGRSMPAATLLVSTLAPILLWALLRPAMRARRAG